MSINVNTLQNVKATAQELLRRIEALENAVREEVRASKSTDTDWPRRHQPSVVISSGAVRRQSMELTRALAELRR